jgi:hypothetical protein
MLKNAIDVAEGSWQMAKMRRICHQPSAVLPSGRFFQRPARCVAGRLPKSFNSK